MQYQRPNCAPVPVHSGRDVISSLVRLRLVPHDITARSPRHSCVPSVAIFTQMRFFIPKDFVSLQIVMGLKGKSVEELIAMVLDEIRQKGYSSVRPFSIGKVEERMILYAQANAITLASDELYMSAKQLQHCMRTSKATKGLVVENIELISFPSNRFQMDLYYDGECFIYTNAQSKFIVHPNYKMKISRELVAQVNFITATKIKDPAEFTLPKYKKI